MIHVKSQLLAVQMQIVWYKITQRLVFARNIWLEIQISDANMHQRHVQQPTNVHRIIHALEIFARQIVTMIKIVWLMNDAFAVRASQFVILMLRVAADKFVKTDCVKRVVATI